jgi:pyruvate/2-oxoglutarate dehydrogenase complex dihydrolipoamide acyltransferase (E2) component
MGGVKKKARSATGKRGRGTAAARRKPAATRKAKPVRKAKPATKAKSAAKAKPAQKAKPPRKPKPAARAKPTASRIVRARDLDPYRKCGPGTSVERLIRVDEVVGGKVETHLVFFDRHGWYCEHGRTCPAVGDARKHARHAPDTRG